MEGPHMFTWVYNILASSNFFNLEKVTCWTGEWEQGRI